MEENWSSDNDEREKGEAAIRLMWALNMKKRKRKRRTCWVKPWLAVRDEKSLYTNLVNELILADRVDYGRFIEMNTETFEVILMSV